MNKKTLIDKSKVREYEDRILKLETQLNSKEQVISVLYNIIKDKIFWDRVK